MKFDDIFKNATMLSDDFLKNECAYELGDLSPTACKAIYRQYYLNMCSAVSDLLYLKPSSAEIEELLIKPYKETECTFGTKKDVLNTSVIESNQRRYLFLMAQYDQLVFDVANGRTNMLRGEDMKWKVAPDALSKLDMLGFCQRTYAVKW